MTSLLPKIVGLIMVMCTALHLGFPGISAGQEEKPPERVQIVAPDGLSARIHVTPDQRSETLQIALDGDVLETVKSQGAFYEVRVPDKKTSGFVLKEHTVPWKRPVEHKFPVLLVVIPLLLILGGAAGAFFWLKAKKDKEEVSHAAAIPNAIRRAEESFRAGDHTQAIADFNSYIRLQGGEVRNPDVYRRLAASYRETGQIQEAAECWEKMRDLGGVRTQEDYALGIELMTAQGKEAEAAALYEDLLQQEIDQERSAQIRQKLVDSYRRLKEPRKYMEHVVSLLGMSGTDPNLLATAVHYLISEQQTDLAIESQNKEFIVAICREFLEDNVMTSEAERIYLKCLGYDRTDLKLHKMLAKMYGQSGDCKKAVSELNILGQIDKDHNDSYMEEAARLYVETGHVPDALAEGNPMIVKKIAQIYLARSEVHPYAVETYEKVLEFQPKAVGINKMLSTVYLTRGELDKYMEKLRLLHEIDGHNRDYLTDLALCVIDNDLIDQTFKEGNRELNQKVMRQLIKRGATTDKAVALLERLTSAEPENLAVRGALIRAYERRGDGKRCLDHMLVALKIQPKDRELAAKAAALAVKEDLLENVLEQNSTALIVATAQEIMQTKAQPALCRRVLERAAAAGADQQVISDYLRSLPRDKRETATRTSVPPAATVKTPTAARPTSGVTRLPKSPTATVTPRSTDALEGPVPRTPTVTTRPPRSEAEKPQPPKPEPKKPQRTPVLDMGPREKTQRPTTKTRTVVTEPPAETRKQVPTPPKRQAQQDAPAPERPARPSEPARPQRVETASPETNRPLKTEQIVELFDSQSAEPSGATTFVSGFGKGRSISDYRPEELLRPATGGLAYKEMDALVTDSWGTLHFGVEVNTSRSVLIRLLRQDLLERLSMKSFVDDISQVAYNLRHENILALEDVVSGITGVMGMVHPYMFKTLEQGMKYGRRPSTPTVLAIMKKIVDAVGHAHYYQGMDGKYRRTYHFHLQPSLILLSEDLKECRLTGFGFSQIFRNFTRASKPRWQEPGMNPATMPPEFFRSRVGTIIEKAADIYSLGAVLYFAATGEFPFEGPSFEDYKFGHTKMTPAPTRLVNPEMPEWVDPVILKCLEKDPEKRWEDVKEIRSAFEEGMG